MFAEILAKLAQNPVRNRIGVALQDDVDLDYGPEQGAQDVLNIRPVIPIAGSKDRKIVTPQQRFALRRSVVEGDSP